MRVQHAPDEGTHARHRDHACPEHRRVGPAPRSRLVRAQVPAPRLTTASPAPRRSRSRAACGSGGLPELPCASNDDRGDGQVDEEGPAPSGSIDERSADEGTDRAGHAAQARPRRRPPGPGRSGKLACRIARLPGVSSAAPMPCRTRATTSTSTFGAAPHSNDAAANPTVPITNTRRRPKRSPSAPPSRINDASG